MRALKFILRSFEFRSEKSRLTPGTSGDVGRLARRGRCLRCGVLIVRNLFLYRFRLHLLEKRKGEGLRELRREEVLDNEEKMKG